MKPGLWLALATLCAAGIAQQNLPAAQSSAVPQASSSDRIAEARAQLSTAERDHPGNTEEIANALVLLIERQRIARQTSPETMTLAQRAATVAEGAAGKESGLYASALDAVALTYVALDHPEQGRPLAEQALDIARRTSPGTLWLANAADALDKACFVLGDYACAVQAGQEAVNAVRAAHVENELYLASMLQDLAQNQLRVGDKAGARKGVEESLAIVDRQAAPAPAMAVLESNAGSFYSFAGQPDLALIHLNKALALSTSLYGPESIQVGYAAGTLADVDMRTGHYDDAWKEYERTLRLHRQWYGPVNTRTADMEMVYGRSLALAGRLPEAVELSLHAHQTQREAFSLAVRVLPERQALALARSGTSSMNVALSVAASHPEVDVAAIYQEEIRSRALVTEEMAQRQVGLNRKNDPEIASLLLQLDQARAATLEAARSAKTSSTGGETYTQATARMERIERDLAERSAAFRVGERSRTVSLGEVRSQLPPASVLISYVAYSRVPVKASSFSTDSVRSYMAFVLHPRSDHVAVFDLGSAAPIESAVSRARNSAEAETQGGGIGSKRNERTYREAALALRRQVWDPLAGELRGAKLVLVVPDGVLNLIPFSAFPDGTGYLVDRPQVVHVLSSERDVLPVESRAKKSGLLAIGNPRFELAAVSNDGAPLHDRSVTCDQFRQLAFRNLPGAAAEVNDISNTWRRWNRREGVEMVTGADATLARFLSDAPRNRVVHIATHAFLLDQGCSAGNPLLNSGLVFAGVNQGSAAAILTSQQIASLDLSGVDWAVLSACNTGNGELRDGEGVSGLQRAFRVAGAHSVVMTLWPVDDDVTRRFMHELYAQRFGGRASTASAIWNSAERLLTERRAAGKSTHPWYWAGFIGSGGWE